MKWKQFYIKRKNKKRLITAPNEELKQIQREILKELEILGDFTFAYGGIKKKSIKQNASIHKNSSLIIRLDIKDFFDSIDTSLLINILKEYFNKELIEKIKKYCLYKNKLPQGAATSPFLSNLYLKKFDIAVYKFCENNFFRYSRYYDDLTFSFKDKEYQEYLKEKLLQKFDNEYTKIKQKLKVKSLIAFVQKELQKYKLKLNRKKIRIMRQGRRQVVTGLVVNQKVNIKRDYYKLLRAVKHRILKNQKATMSLKEYLGHLAFVKSINKNKFEKLKIK